MPCEIKITTVQDEHKGVCTCGWEAKWYKDIKELNLIVKKHVGKKKNDSKKRVSQ